MAFTLVDYYLDVWGFVPSVLCYSCVKTGYLAWKAQQQANISNPPTPVIPPPYITDFNPTFGQAGDTITIYGLYLDNTTQVKIGTLTCTGLNIVSAGEVTAVIPNGATRNKVTVVNASGTHTSTIHWVPGTGSGGGSGDMLKSVYDPNNDGIVNEAATVSGLSSAGNNKYVGTNGTGVAGIFSLPSAGIADPGVDGILARTALNAAIARTLTAGSSKISISNGDGVSGNPSIDVVEANLTLGNIGGSVGTSKIADDAVTYAKLQNVAANSVLANNTASSGDAVEVALAANQLLGRGATGNVAAITLGSNLSMTGTTLNAASGGSNINYAEFNVVINNNTGSANVSYIVDGQGGVPVQSVGSGITNPFDNNFRMESVGIYMLKLFTLSFSNVTQGFHTFFLIAQTNGTTLGGSKRVVTPSTAGTISTEFFFYAASANANVDLVFTNTTAWSYTGQMKLQIIKIA